MLPAISSIEVAYELECIMFCARDPSCSAVHIPQTRTTPVFTCQLLPNFNLNTQLQMSNMWKTLYKDFQFVFNDF